MPETLARHINVLSGWAFPSDGFNELEGLPLIRIRDLGHGTPEVKFKGSYDPRYVIGDGDVLIGMDGDFSVEKWAGGAALLNQRVCKVESASENLDQGFLYWYLMPHVAEIHRKTPQTTVRHLSASSLGHILAPAISVAEQRTVNEILNTLDTTIRQTEAIIEKLKQVKQGLLHDLLTRGIDANGELRPPQNEAPHLYKESPLGWIPREWGIERLENLLSEDDPAMRSGPFGSALLKHELVERGLPLLGIDNVHVERFDTNFSRFVTEKKFNELARYAVRPNDLMITIMGTVGRCCVVPEDIGRALSSKHTWTITLNQEKYSPLLAMLQINYCTWVLRQFAKDEQGGIMSAIRSDTLRTLSLPTPPIEEQHKIESRLQAIITRIATESATALKLRLEKSGLMDDLLTGRVRVTPLLQEGTAPP